MRPSSSAWSRRDVLRATGALPAWYVAGLPGASFAQETSPNERPRVALVGCGGMGTGDAMNARRFGDIVAVCDVDKGRLEKAKAAFANSKAYKDYREVCDSPDVDVIINATPDHWHTFVNLRAVSRGKDVYSEKPLTLTIDEGKRLVAAVRQHERILQTGSQQRSDRTFRLACELVRNGRVGRVERVRVWVPMGRREGPFTTAPVPPELDWDMWQGQTAAVEYVPERCHGNYRYWWDYSGGTVTDWGAHHNDIALWGLGRDRSGPVSVEGRATIDPIPGGYTAASQFEVKYTYDDGVEHYCNSTSANGPYGTVTGEPKPGERYHGVQFEGSEGWIFVTRENKLEASDPALIETPLAEGAERLYASNDHMGNFFECIKTRKAPVAEVEIGHRSVSACHLGAIAIRLGRHLAWDPAAEQFIDDKEASAMVERQQRKGYTYEEAVG